MSELFKYMVHNPQKMVYLNENIYGGAFFMGLGRPEIRIHQAFSGIKKDTNKDLVRE